MSIKNYILLITICLCYTSCINTHGYSGHHTILLKPLSSNYDEVYFNIRGNGQTFLEESSGIFKLDIEPELHGTSYLFGMFKIKESDADRDKRIEIFKGNVLVRTYSVNELLELNYEIVDDTTKVYLLLEL